MDEILRQAKLDDCLHYVFPSRTFDPKRNPLTVAQKIEFLNLAFPNMHIVDDPDMINPFRVLKKFSDAGIENVTMVVGSDRANDFYGRVIPYLNHDDLNKRLNFNSFNIMTSGQRSDNPISGTLMRLYVESGDFESFVYGLPDNLTVADAERLYILVRDGLKGQDVNIRGAQPESDGTH